MTGVWIMAELLDVIPGPLLIAGLLFLGGALLATLVLLGFSAMKRRVVTGQEGLLHQRGIALTTVNRQGGSVQVSGEQWAARSAVPVQSGQAVEVLAVSGLVLKVQPAKGEEEF